MDLNQFKPKNGERYIIVDNGNPTMVLMSYEDYKESCSREDSSNPPSVISQPAPQEVGEQKLEDLPF